MEWPRRGARTTVSDGEPQLRAALPSRRVASALGPRVGAPSHTPHAASVAGTGSQARVPRAGARLPRGRFVRANSHTHSRTLREREREYTEKLKRTYTLREIFDRRAKLASELSRSLGLELYLWGLYLQRTHTRASPLKRYVQSYTERLDERTSPTGLTGIRRREVIRIVRVAGRCRAPACGCCPSSTNTQRSRRGRHHPRPGIYKAVVRSDPKSSAPGTPRKKIGLQNKPRRHKRTKRTHRPLWAPSSIPSSDPLECKSPRSCPRTWASASTRLP